MRHRDKYDEARRGRDAVPSHVTFGSRQPEPSSVSTTLERECRMCTEISTEFEVTRQKAVIKYKDCKFYILRKLLGVIRIE